MEYEDSRNAIFCDPNAYIQGCEHKQIKKVVFAEPYDCLPTFFIDNDFKKHNCDCVPKQKPPKLPCAPSKPQFNFDIKSLMPILIGLLGKGNTNTDLTKMLSNLTNLDVNSSGFDMQKLISVVAQNPSILQNVLSLFKGKGLSGLFKKANKTSTENTAKQTDHIIKNYTRVET